MFKIVAPLTRLIIAGVFFGLPFRVLCFLEEITFFVGLLLCGFVRTLRYFKLITKYKRPLVLICLYVLCRRGGGIRIVIIRNAVGLKKQKDNG